MSDIYYFVGSRKNDKPYTIPVVLKYDGRWEGRGEMRSWTVLSPLTDKNGFSRQYGSFGLASLKTLGVVSK